MNNSSIVSCRARNHENMVRENVCYWPWKSREWPWKPRENREIQNHEKKPRKPRKSRKPRKR